MCYCHLVVNGPGSEASIQQERTITDFLDKLSQESTDITYQQTTNS